MQIKPKNIFRAFSLKYISMFRKFKNMKIFYFLTFILSINCQLYSQTSEDVLQNSPNYDYSTLQKGDKTVFIKEQITNSTVMGLPLPAYNNSLRVNSLLDSIYNSNKNIKYMEGYRIQVYIGENKDEANAAKEYLYKIYPQADIYTVYKQPTYRVKLGDFINRHEVKRILEKKILRSFPKAILIPDNVFIKPKVYYE
ncbi:MAG: SPOR domain-containing protein [Cytophagales bacterium]|nr:MAG: SPOR domain-containing protein [Cytophagales bacterium]